MTIDVAAYFNETLPAKLREKPAEARRIGGKYQLNVADAGTWTIDLVADPPAIKAGTEAVPCTISLSADDAKLVIAHPQSAVQLFVAGRMKVKGNALMARNLLSILEL